MEHRLDLHDERYLSSRRRDRRPDASHCCRQIRKEIGLRCGTYYEDISTFVTGLPVGLIWRPLLDGHYEPGVRGDHGGHRQRQHVFITFRFFLRGSAFMMVAAVPILINEIVPTHIRGALVDIHAVAFVLGYALAVRQELCHHRSER